MGRGLPLKAGQDGCGNQGNGDSEVCIAEEEPDLGREDLWFCGIPVMGRCLARVRNSGSWVDTLPLVSYLVVSQTIIIFRTKLTSGTYRGREVYVQKRYRLAWPPAQHVTVESCRFPA